MLLAACVLEENGLPTIRFKVLASFMFMRVIEQFAESYLNLLELSEI